jgi:hypothetical protein
MTTNWNRFLSFFWFSRFASWCSMNVWCHATCQTYTFLTKRKSAPNIDGVRIVGGKVALIPVVSFRGMTYANMLSVPVEEHNRYMTYITTYPSSGAHMFNAAWIALHTLQECIHVMRKWPQDIPRSPHTLGARSWLFAWWTRNLYRTIGTVLKQTPPWGDRSEIHITRWEDTYFLTLS